MEPSIMDSPTSSFCEWPSPEADEPSLPLNEKQNAIIHQGRVMPILDLPSELVVEILDKWLGTPALTMFNPADHERLRPRYRASLDISPFPIGWQVELMRLLRLKWLRSEKEFTDVRDFFAVHIACLGRKNLFRMNAKMQELERQQFFLPPVMQLEPDLRLHGLEKIRLDLAAHEYFAMFRVHVWPFPRVVHHDFYNRHDEYGAASFLRLTKELTLVFGENYTYAHPWTGLDFGAWTEEMRDGVPRVKTNLCTAGLIVDWILTFAWRNHYIRHIKKITLEGDVQDWVKDKWTKVFAGTHPEQDSIADEKRIWDIRNRGLREARANGERYVATEHYPPLCKCEVRFVKSRDWELLEKNGEEEWDDVVDLGQEPLWMAPWYDGWYEPVGVEW